jgi:hypothetical protein
VWVLHPATPQAARLAGGSALEIATADKPDCYTTLTATRYCM